MLFLLPITILLACDPATKVVPQEFDLAAAKSIIMKQTAEFTEAHITKDTSYLNNVFTEDARVMAPDAEVVTGKADIAKVNEEWVNYGIYEFEEVSTRFYGSGAHLMDEGNYKLVYGPDSTVEVGKYLNVWKKVDNEWLMYANIWNQSPGK